MNHTRAASGFVLVPEQKCAFPAGERCATLERFFALTQLTPQGQSVIINE